MGDPRRLRKKYYTPSHPWQGDRISEENKILKEYGLKNKKEIWKARSVLKNAAAQAKKLSGERSEQARKESEQLLKRLVKLGLLKSNSGLGDVLNIKFGDVLNRRLQTMIYKNGLARSMKQARQFVVHGHIMVNDKLVDIPSYIVNVDEQSKISFNPGSELANKEHPERIELKDGVKEPEERKILEEKDKKREEKRRRDKRTFKKEGKKERR